MRARPFFYVCAGLFLLAFGYHLGARAATAQVASGIECASIESNSNTNAVIGRQVWFFGGYGAGVPPPKAVTPVIPGTAAVVACSGNGGNCWVLLADGEEWQWDSLAWTLMTTWPAGATPAVQKTWGQVKVEHR